jgi:hypothetical protein
MARNPSQERLKFFGMHGIMTGTYAPPTSASQHSIRRRQQKLVRSSRQILGAALEDASRGRSTDGVGLRADYRDSGSVSVWLADRELSETGAGEAMLRQL